jgi:hypothetical protein
VGLIRFFGHLEEGGYDGPDDGKWIGRRHQEEAAASAS